MQTITFLGVPTLLWGLICYVISAVWIFVWPKPKAGEPARSFRTHFILRWFHTLAWVFLAIFIMTIGRFPLAALATGMLAAATYLTFGVTLFKK
ncbi:MAG: hypothetical protein CO094_14200 [Anaerolineae bacterium CG_4_9_14_3_um_filter_57_17]|nr:hypothetical protein [bacterium]NCT22207.1 hypothetical protein [bacterium]OIO85338.1 MAG: hypothetical protein AUK01_06345 [Anaerolineae bacterium CG2_30_57_67]PJB64031.1 MAG: hypothetical protein CO094_14200 [Anaerolineae bacterium CG_4_9_14_3_um_filter_57_17]